MNFNYFVLFLSFVTLSSNTELDDLRFPDDFLFGVSTSAYQIEGAWNEGGKSESIWDRLVHNKSHLIRYNFHGDEAAKSYHLYKSDIDLLKELGVDFYRFSIAWSRILPTGRINIKNQEGIDYYNNIINELIKYNITPMITIYHWDLPQVLEDEGGFLNDSFPSIFKDYAKLLFDLYGDRVKYWVTFNEPHEICVQGYGSNLKAPARNYNGYGEYICAKNLLISHAKVYHLYNNIYKTIQQGKIGICLSIQWAEGKTDSDEDRISAEEGMEFFSGLFLHPIYSPKGNYPDVIRKRVPKERLANLPFDVEIRNTSDFIGVNHYDMFYTTRKLPRVRTMAVEKPSLEDDYDATVISLRRWSKEWIKNGPTGFGKLLKWLQNYTNNADIYILESGFATNPGLNDLHRVWYYRRYLIEILVAIKNGVKVKAFSPWSLMDNFEWMFGYSERYGLYEIDFDDPSRKRMARRSAMDYKRILETRTIDPDYINDIIFPQDTKLKKLSQFKFIPQIDTSPSLTRILKNRGNKTMLDCAIEALNSQIKTYNRPYDYV